MFSGIIKATGIVNAISPLGTTRQVTIESAISGSLAIDQSIAHDGVCLTIVAVDGNQHKVDVVQETLSKTSLASLEIGHLINLEPSLTLSTLLDGHLVQGHVDTTLQCLEITDLHGSWKFKFAFPAEYMALVIPHGSICLNGVSLTIAQLYDDAFEVAIIPYTYRHTNFQHLQPGDWVNVEFDLIGKYLLRQQQ